MKNPCEAKKGRRRSCCFFLSSPPWHDSASDHISEHFQDYFFAGQIFTSHILLSVAAYALVSVFTPWTANSE